MKSKENPNSAKTKVKNLTSGCKIPEVVNKLIFHEALNAQVEKNLNKLRRRNKQHNHFAQELSGKMFHVFSCTGKICKKATKYDTEMFLQKRLAQSVMYR